MVLAIIRRLFPTYWVLNMMVIEDNREYTKYEVARILGVRALQLAMGAPPLVKPRGVWRPLELAMKEWEKGIIPITVVRE